MAGTVTFPSAGIRQPRAAWPLPIHVIEAGAEPSSRAYFIWKRILDVAGALFLLLLLSPLLLLTGLLIRLDTAGPVLFEQRRVGVKRKVENGRVRWILYTFAFYKFRSMRTGSDSTTHQAYINDFYAGRIRRSPTEPKFKLVSDSRITRVGRFIRKTSIDELPQLLNVLKGDMSLVGPRPALIYEIALYADRHYERFCAPAGITGLWQATARSQVPFEEMIDLDVTYARQASLWLDMKLLALTIPAVLSCRGAE